MLITKEKTFYQTFFRLFSMIVLQNVIVLSVNLADNIMIGAYSEISLSGVAAVNQLQFIFQQLTMGIGDALVTLGSQYWGQKRTAPVKQIGKAALLVGLGGGLILFALTGLMPAQILRIFTPSDAIIAEGVRYMAIVRWTYILYGITAVLLALLRSVEVVRIAFWVSLSTLVINCSINYVLIGGHFGIFLPELFVVSLPRLVIFKISHFSVLQIKKSHQINGISLYFTFFLYSE
jgi:Na+-driven multidrug efflux pump